MGCLPFCLCTKKFNTKILSFIALGCNVVKIGLSVGNFFLIVFSIFCISFIFNICELVFTVVNLILLAIVLVAVRNGKAYDKRNKCCKILCLLTIVFSFIILVLSIMTLVWGIILYKQDDRWRKKEKIRGGAPTISWVRFLVPSSIYLVIEIIHFIAVNYLFKLLKLRTDRRYDDYLKGGQVVEQNSMVNVEIAQTQPPTTTLSMQSGNSDTK